MCQFLWVEDFEGKIKDTVETVFASIINIQDIPDSKEEVIDFLKKQHILLETSFADAFDFIRNSNKLNQVDCIILDIDLKFSEDIEIEDHFLPILQKYGSIQDANSKKNSILELKKQAGYELYVELIMNLGFPKDRVIFCSNHGNEMSIIKQAFETAKMQLPTIYSKDRKDELKEWILKHKGNSYITLRRGIIEASHFLKNSLDNIQFNEFLKEKKEPDELKANILDYLETLEKFLPLVEPDNKARYYKLFVRTLSHEWEDNATPESLSNNHPKWLKTFGWIMKSTRNRIAHNQFTQNFDEQIISFLFIVAMRAMFKLEESVQSYEYILFSLFSSITEREMLSILKNKEIPLAETHIQMRDKLLENAIEIDEQTLLSFNKMLNKLGNKVENFDYIKALYQIYWLTLPKIKVTHEEMIKNQSNSWTFKTNYELVEPSNYGKKQLETHPNSFLFHFSRHIYNHSFEH